MTGARRSVVVPSPSCPEPLSPQHRTAPPLVTAHVCQPWALTATAPLARPLTGTGVRRFVVVPSPSCPTSLSPQHSHGAAARQRAGVIDPRRHGDHSARQPVHRHWRRAVGGRPVPKLARDVVSPAQNAAPTGHCTRVVKAPRHIDDLCRRRPAGPGQRDQGRHNRQDPDECRQRRRTLTLPGESRLPTTLSRLLRKRDPTGVSACCHERRKSHRRPPVRTHSATMRADETRAARARHRSENRFHHHPDG